MSAQSSGLSIFTHSFQKHVAEMIFSPPQSDFPKKIRCFKKKVLDFPGNFYDKLFATLPKFPKSLQQIIGLENAPK
jgi:hypothetical protein